MAIFFNSIAQFKAKQSEVENDASFLVSLESSIETALQIYIEPWVGTVLLETWRTAYVANALSAAQAVAVGHLQAALSALALHDWSLQGSLRTGNQGLTAPENRAFKYERIEYREKKMKDGKEALERLLVFLENNVSAFPTWTKDKHFEHFLNTASAFRQAYSEGISRPTFDLLRGIIERVEYHYIEKVLPAAYFTTLKTAFQTGAADANQKKLINMLRIAVANYTVDLALQRGIVQLQGGYVVAITRERDSAGGENWKMPSVRDISFAGETHRMWGNQDMSRWRDYVVANKADFSSIFSTLDGGSSTAADAWDLRPEEVKNPPAPIDPTAPKVPTVIFAL